jgi:hypothetical protein
MKPVGIDKIKLLSNDFTIDDAYSGAFAIDNGIRQGSSQEGVPHLFTDGYGNPVRAYKAYHNSKETNANYTVQRLGANVYLVANFNPSKMVHPYKLSEVGSDDYTRALKAIQSELSSIGIRVNLKSANLSRIDISAQYNMGHPLSSYQPAFRLMGGARAKKIEYQGGYTFGNKTHQCVFYDKITEMELRKMGQSCKGESNLLRGEVRLYKGSYISNTLKASTLSDMEAMGTHGLSDAYTRYLNRNVFAKVKGVHQSVIDYNDEVEYIRSLLMMGRAEWKQYFVTEGAVNKIEQIGGYDAMRRMFQDAGMSRQASYKATDWVMTAYRNEAQRASKRDILTTSNLIDELYMKFAA